MEKAKKKPIHLFYCAEAEDLARNIADKSDAIQLQSISWRSFADGFPNLFINNAHDIRGQHVAFLASFSSPAVIFEQISVIFALPKLFIASFTLVLPFFPTGSFERMEEEGDVATAFTMARVLSMIPKSRGGPTSLVIYDIHALQERFYFGDDVLPCFETGIPLLLQRLRQLPDADNVTIAFPDDGAWKRFHKQLQHFPMVVCAKVREGDKRIVRLKEGNPEGQHVVIVDDLVQSGGTLIECQVLFGSSEMAFCANESVGAILYSCLNHWENLEWMLLWVFVRQTDDSNVQSPKRDWLGINTKLVGFPVYLMRLEVETSSDIGVGTLYHSEQTTSSTGLAGIGTDEDLYSTYYGPTEEADLAPDLIPTTEI